MDQILRSKLESLPPLILQEAAAQTRTCKICNRRCYFFDVVDFNKCCSYNLYPYSPSGIPVQYYRCQHCGFLFTDFCDDWSPQVFQNYIYNEEYIKVDGDYKEVRPAKLAVDTAKLLLHQMDKRLLDYGSGSAFFTGAMRKSGFLNVEGYDPFSSPARPEGPFDVITCFEVIEHTTDPIAVLSDMKSFLAPKGIILLSTTVQPADIETIRANWWYVGPRNGHISIFTDQALAIAAEKAGLELYVDATGRQWLCAKGQAELFDSIDIALYRIANVELRAPVEGYGQWHGIEPIGERRMRWTASNRVCWTASYSGPALLFIQLPVVMYINNSFIKESYIEINGQDYALNFSQGFLTTRAHQSTRINELTLVTPPPLKPCDIRKSVDQRPLGLAVEM